MIRSGAGSILFDDCLPRMRGDDPLKSTQSKLADGFAPHARG